MRLSSRLAIGWLLVCLFLFLPASSFAVTKAGINIATQYDYLEQALSAIRPGGWLYVMGSPADQEFLNLAAARAEEENVHLVIRGQCGGEAPTSDYATSWAQVLASLPTNNKIYFMPWNEPNGPAAGDIISPALLNSYINALIKAFDRYGLRESGAGVANKVFLLSPMINQYGNIEEYAGLLRDQNANFFNQFDGISMNLYALYQNQAEPQIALPDDPFRNSIGYPKVLEVLQVPDDTPVYGIESGVAIWGRGGPLVRYSDARKQLEDLYRTWVQTGTSNVAYRHWQEDPNFKMFTIFSYSPDAESPDYNRHWLFEEESKGVLEAMSSVGGGELPVAAESLAGVTEFSEDKARMLEAEPIDVDKFSACGGASTNLVYADYYDTGNKGQLYKLVVSKWPWDKSLNIKLIVVEGQLRHPDREWNAISTSWKQGRNILKPVEFGKAATDTPPPELTDYVFAPVCRVAALVRGQPDPSRPDEEPEDIELDPDLRDKIKVNIEVSDSFYKKPGESFPAAAPPGRFTQAMLVPGQALKEDKPIQIVAPPPPNEEQANAPLPDCSPDAFVHLDQAIEVPSGGSVGFGGDFLSGLRDIIGGFFRRFLPSLVQELVVYFQWRSFKPLASYNQMVYAGRKTGIASAFLPSEFQQMDKHGQTLAPITVEGGGELEPVSNVLAAGSQASSGTSCPSGRICQPDPLQNVSTKKPLYMLCAFLPGEFCSDNQPNPGIFAGQPSEIPGDTSTPPTLPITLPVKAPESLAAIFEEAADWQDVPAGVIAGIAAIEGSHMWQYSDEEIGNYSKAGGKDPYPDFLRGVDPAGIGCRVNDCAAAGPMQFLIGPDYLGDLDRCPTAKKWKQENRLDSWPNVWGYYQGQVSNHLGYQSDVCNIRDSILGAAVKMASDARRCGAGDWDKDLVFCVAEKYFGLCTKTFSHLGNRTYCQFVWDYFQRYEK